MLFWSFMLATSSLIPIAMMVVGSIFLKATPKKILQAILRGKSEK